MIGSYIFVSNFSFQFPSHTCFSIFPLHGYWVFAYENFRGSCCWFQLSRNADLIHSIKISLTSVSESGRFVADKWFTYVAFNGHSIYLTPLIAMCQVTEASHTLDKLPLSQSNVNSAVHTYVSPIQVGVGVGTSLVCMGSLADSHSRRESGYARLRSSYASPTTVKL